MDDVRGLFLGMPHGTTPAAVTTNKNIIMSSFKSSRDIQKKEEGPESLKFNAKVGEWWPSLRFKSRIFRICLYLRKDTSRGYTCLSGHFF